jgi:hypothetical protein
MMYNKVDYNNQTILITRGTSFISNLLAFYRNIKLHKVKKNWNTSSIQPLKKTR